MKKTTFALLGLTLFCALAKPELRQAQDFSRFPNPTLISLGFDCTIARVLRDNNLRTFALPFDWIRSSLDGACRLFEDDFKDFLNPTYLTQESGFIFNKKYTVAFYHDFSEFDAYLDDLDTISKKYKRRIKRLYKALTSGQKIYLFRCSSTLKPWDLDPQEQNTDKLIQLRDILLKKFPKSDFTIIAISNHDSYKQEWHIDRIRNFYMVDYDTSSKEWINILSTLNLIE